MIWSAIEQVINGRDIDAICRLVYSSDILELDAMRLIYAADLLRKAGFPDLSFHLADVIKNRNPEITDAERLKLRYLEADLFLDAKKFQDAIYEYNKILNTEKTGVAFGNRGLAYWECGDYSEALSDYKEAVALDPENSIILRGLGEMYLKNHDPSAAIPILKKAISLNKDYPEAYAALGLARVETDDWVKAYRCFQAALALDPENSIAKRGIKEIENWYEIE